MLIIGTGIYGLMKVDDKLKESLKSLGIETIINKNADAVSEYNRFYKYKKVVCALHLTCWLIQYELIKSPHCPNPKAAALTVVELNTTAKVLGPGTACNVLRWTPIAVG